MEQTDAPIRTGEAKDLLLSGLIELSRGEDREALRIFSELIAAGDDSVLATLCAAQLLMRCGDAAGAAALLEPLAAREPGLPEAHALLGRAYRGMCRPIEAIRSLRTALDLEPANSETRNALEELVDVQEP